MRRVWIGWVFFLLGLPAIGQPLVEGVVLDADTNEPIPFVSIGIAGTSIGTSSNQNGRFSLQVKTGSVLSVSCIGYETIQVPVNGTELTIKLKSVATQLNTLVVMSRQIRPDNIVRKALARVGTNYNPNPFLQQFFYRHYCKDGEEYGRLIEAAVEIWKPRGYKAPQATAFQRDQVRITQLRRSLDKTRLAQGHEPIAVNSVIESDIVGYQTAQMENASFFSNVSTLQTDLPSYSLRMKGTTNYNGVDVHEIGYIYKKDSVKTPTGEYRVRMIAKGSLFITTDTYAIVKMEEERTYGTNITRKTVFYRQYDSYYYPYHFIVTGENGSEGGEKHSFHIELMSVEVKTTGNNQFVGKSPDKSELLNIPYDSVYWTTNTLLKTTPLEDDIISDLGGGLKLSKQFNRYKQFELCTTSGGTDAEKKIEWLLEDSKGNRILYFIFCSDQLVPMLREIELAKQLHKQYRNEVMFVFISVDEDELKWRNRVKAFNLFSDGMVNYRISKSSELLKRFQVNHLPGYLLIDQQGRWDTGTKLPGDPGLVATIERLIHAN